MTLPPPSPKPCPPKKRRYPAVQDFSDISSEEDEMTVAPPCPPKRSRAPETVECEPDILYTPDIVILGPSSPAKKPEKPDIIYLGSYKSSRKTSPQAPPNSPTYPPPPTVPQTIWFEGTSVSNVYPAQVIFLVILTLIKFLIFSGRSNDQPYEQQDAAHHPTFN